jgi:hypothetical protein
MTRYVFLAIVMGIMVLAFVGTTGCRVATSVAGRRVEAVSGSVLSGTSVAVRNDVAEVVVGDRVVRVLPEWIEIDGEPPIAIPAATENINIANKHGKVQVFCDGRQVR